MSFPTTGGGATTFSSTKLSACASCLVGTATPVATGCALPADTYCLRTVEASRCVAYAWYMHACMLRMHMHMHVHMCICICICICAWHVHGMCMCMPVYDREVGGLHWVAGRPPRPLPFSHGHTRDEAARSDGGVNCHRHWRRPCKRPPTIEVCSDTEANRTRARGGDRAI